MNITSFNPLIVTGNAQAAIALFEAMGFERRHGITVTSNGKDITSLPAHECAKIGIGRTFQIPQSLNEMTVWENVIVGALCHTSNMGEAMNKVNEVLELCGMEKFRDMLAGKLNVAQKKRLEIARAMATDPKLLLLDETMAGLTATERKEAVDLIRKINSMGVAILTIEHNMDVVMSVSNRVVVLVSGRLLMVGSPQEVVSNPEVISAYLGGGSKDESDE